LKLNGQKKALIDRMQNNLNPDQEMTEQGQELIICIILS